MKQKIEQFQERMHITSGRKLTENILKVGQRIKQARMEHKLSQAELGEKIGCSNNHMSHVEIGQTKPSLPMMLKLSLKP